MIKVYRFAFYDSLLKHDRMSLDFATTDAIAERRGTIFSETERLVEESLIGEDGIIRAVDMPPREAAEERRWMPPRRDRASPRSLRRG